MNWNYKLETDKQQGNGKIKTDSLSSGAEQEGIGVKQEDAESITRRVQEAIPATPGAQKSAREIKKEQ